MEVLPSDNYAVAGATTGRNNSNDGFLGMEFPGLLDEIDAFRVEHQAQDVSDSLFLVWTGANDFSVP
jgi:hypothetical protein